MMNTFNTGMLCYISPAKYRQVELRSMFLRRIIKNLSAMFDKKVFMILDMDESNTKKEGVSFACKKFMMRYAPMMAYIGKENYLVNTELREDKQYCQSGTLGFLCRKITDKPVLVRFELGNDVAKNGAYYIVNRNLRKEDKSKWADSIRSWFKNISELIDGKKIYVNSTFKDIFYTTESGEQQIICNRIVYEIIEQSSSHVIQLFLEPEFELNMFWTNLGDIDRDIIDLTDMGIEYFQSSKIDTNGLVFEMIVYNVICMLGQKTVNY